jgi:CrcB protein
MTDHDDILEQAALPRLGLSPGVLVAIGLGGALGTVARFLLSSAFSDSARQFPTTTLLINLSGSLAIGLLVPLVENLAARVPLLRPFVIVGLLGGWTTYSALAVDAVTLAQHRHGWLGLLSVALTLGGGLALVLGGNSLGTRLVTR